MKFGIQFFPVTSPAMKSGADYWADALRLVDLVDELGYATVRTVEHYFHRYGGYSPSPIAFLCAAAMRTKKARLVTGAVLPAFNHPLKLASEIALADAISGGRMEIGFARAFLPLEFTRFNVPLDESRARFEEGMEIMGRVLEQENVSYTGRFFSFEDTTILPRPTQTPRPPFWVAALQTAESFENAGRLGHGIMGIPMTGGKMRELIDIYRNAWTKAGHAGRGRVMLAFHMYCSASPEEARATTEAQLNSYLKSLVEAASEWTGGTSSKDYPGYDKMIHALDQETWETQVQKNAAWIGTPDTIIRQIREYDAMCGGIDHASLQVNFGTLDTDKAAASMRLFSQQVMPAFA